MEPINELGVIVEFVRQEAESGFKIVTIQAAFPDAVVKKDDQRYRVEFEYRASNFHTHKHDVRAVDLVICWEKDVDCVLPVLALSEPGWAKTDLTLPTETEREATYWQRRALLAERRLSTLTASISRTSEPSGDAPTRYEDFVDLCQEREIEPETVAEMTGREIVAAGLASGQRSATNWRRQFAEDGGNDER